MPFRALVLTSDTFNTWLAATNETIDYVSNTSVFLTAQASGSPSAATGNAALNGVLTVTALRANTNAVFSGANVYINATSLTLVSATTISGAATLTNTLTAQGPVVIQGSSLTVNGSAVTAFSGSGTLTSNVATTVANTFTVTGTANLAGTLAVTGAATLSNTLAVTGAATLSSTLAVTGAATVSNTLAVTGATTLATVNVASTMNVAGTLTVSANVTIGNSTSSTGFLTVRQTATFQNTVSMAGLLTTSAGLAVSGGSFTVGSGFTINATGFVTAGDWRGNTIATTYTAAKVVTVNSQSPDVNGNVTLNASMVSGAMDLTTAQTATGRKSFSANLTSGGMATATGSLGALEIVTSGTNAAFLTFHRSGNYGVYLGLDTDNVLKVGGWSAGAVANPILLANNFNSYAPTLTGTGASGTWNINILGSAASAATATTATSASSATSATNATYSATQATGANDTTIATTAFVKNVLNSGSTFSHSISGSAASATTAASVAASGVTAGTFPSGQFTFTTGLTVGVGSSTTPSLKVNNASSVSGGVYAGSTAVEFGARFDNASSYSIMRAHHGSPQVDFIVGGSIPFTINDGAVSVGSGSYPTTLSLWGPSTLRGHVYPGNNLQYDLGDNGSLLYTERWRTLYCNNVNTTSDVRFKEVVQPSIPNALVLVDAVTPFLYYRTDDENKSVAAGFAAQQVRSVLDAALGTSIVTGDEATMQLGMTHDNMIAVLWAAVRELSQTVRELRGEPVQPLHTLPSEIANLSAVLVPTGERGRYQLVDRTASMTVETKRTRKKSAK